MSAKKNETNYHFVFELFQGRAIARWSRSVQRISREVCGRETTTVILHEGEAEAEALQKLATPNFAVTPLSDESLQLLQLFSSFHSIYQQKILCSVFLFLWLFVKKLVRISIFIIKTGKTYILHFLFRNYYNCLICMQHFDWDTLTKFYSLFFQLKTVLIPFTSVLKVEKKPSTQKNNRYKFSRIK